MFYEEIKSFVMEEDVPEDDEEGETPTDDKDEDTDDEGDEGV